jgi:hypothetical protein
LCCAKVDALGQKSCVQTTCFMVDISDERKMESKKGVIYHFTIVRQSIEKAVVRWFHIITLKVKNDIGKTILFLKYFELVP